MKFKSIPGIRIIRGEVSESALDGILKASDASIFNYNPESFLNSGSVMRSLSAGLPVVAPRIGCLESYLSNEFSVTFDTNRPLGLKKHCKRLHRDWSVMKKHEMLLLRLRKRVL